METVESPVAGVAVPLASVMIAFMTHTGSAPVIGSGGPKLQFASSPQEPGVPPQSASVEQAIGPPLPPMQCLPGPAPFVQLVGPVPALAMSGTSPPDGVPRSKSDVAWSGIWFAGVAAIAPPM